MGPYSGADYRNGSDIQSDSVQPQVDDASLPPLDNTPLPRSADGGVVLPDGRIVHPSVTVTQQDAGATVQDGGTPAGTSRVLQGGSSIGPTSGNLLPTRIGATAAPVGLTQPDGRAVSSLKRDTPDEIQGQH